jgi:hypothetical protein
MVSDSTTVCLRRTAVEALGWVAVPPTPTASCGPIERGDRRKAVGLPGCLKSGRPSLRVRSPLSRALHSFLTSALFLGFRLDWPPSDAYLVTLFAASFTFSPLCLTSALP